MDLLGVIDGHGELAFDACQNVPELLEVVPAEDALAAVVFAFVIGGLESPKKIDRPAVLL